MQAPKTLEGSESKAQDPEHLNDLEERIRVFLRRQDDIAVGDVFRKHADAARQLILPDRLRAALGELGVHVGAEEAEALMASMDLEGRGGLDSAEFARAARQPSSQVEQFVGRLPLAGMLASCLATPGAEEPLKELCGLAPGRLRAAVAVFSRVLLEEAQRRLDELKETVAAMAAEAHESDGSGSKFAVFGMNAGTVEDYYKGLYERIGE